MAPEKGPQREQAQQPRRWDEEAGLACGESGGRGSRRGIMGRAACDRTSKVQERNSSARAQASACGLVLQSRMGLDALQERLSEA